MFFAPAAHYVVPTTMIDVLKHLGLTTNLQLCVDAGDINSWPGSGQSWKDTSGNGIDIINGDSASDTDFDYTFVGVAGRQSASEYWVRAASGSQFTYPAQTWTNQVHKNNGKLSIAGWVYRSSSVEGGFAVATKAGATEEALGWEFEVARDESTSPTGTLTFVVGNGSSIAAVVASSNTVPGGAFSYVGMAIDEQAGTYLMQVNGTQATGAISYSSPSASSASDIIFNRIGGEEAQRYNSFAFWDVALSASQLTAIYNATKAKFGL